ncbi:uncharacterized protein LOC143188353 [Calliopsis andreniformis]|uniref:uncharacterized protein LOC143188353 n=1 Tax=Calliopsis andreniformis TaxID=337506 RepID=UPI003FCC94F1
MTCVSNFTLYEAQNMGNILKQSFTALKIRKDRDLISRTECHDFDVIKRIWQIVEKNSPYYGFAFSTVLFKNHPQYAKYFEEEAIPEFVQEAKLKKKFAVIYDIVSALFIDYQDKPVQREYLLGYIAMVHKDMGLTLKDFENFMSDLLETLVIELPHVMSEDYIVIQLKYLNDLTKILMNLMDQHRKRIEHLLTRKRTLLKKCCPWLHNPQSQIIYGFPLKYWLYKKRYWEYRRAIWVSIEADVLGRPIPENPVIERRKSLFARRKSMEVRRAKRKKRKRMKTEYKHVSSDSDYLSDQKDKKNDRALPQTSLSTHYVSPPVSVVSSRDSSFKMEKDQSQSESGAPSNTARIRRRELQIPKIVIP